MSRNRDAIIMAKSAAYCNKCGRRMEIFNNINGTRRCPNFYYCVICDRDKVEKIKDGR